MRKQTLTIVLLFTASLIFAQTTFKVGGYVKFDDILTKYDNGKPIGLLGDFHIPSLIPVGTAPAYYDNEFQVKESRFNFDISKKINGKPIRAFVEMDFMLSPGGNERVSNSYNPRLRHFFFDYNGLLVGQTWSTFMIVILPNDLDFVGAAEGVVFMRQPQVRYTLKGEKGNWQFSLENSQYTITSVYKGVGKRTTVSGVVPDLVVRKNFKGDWGNFSIAAIARGINYFDRTVISAGYGITTGGKFKVRKQDDIRFSVTAGSGLGRYVGLNFLNAAIIDSSANSLSNINSINGYISYQLHWSDKFQSNVNASVLFGDNGDGVYDKAKLNKTAQSYSANLLYTPVSNLMFGIEYMYATRELENKDKGSMNRIMLSAKYKFGYTHIIEPK